MRQQPRKVATVSPKKALPICLRVWLSELGVILGFSVVSGADVYTYSMRLCARQRSMTRETPAARARYIMMMKQVGASVFFGVTSIVIVMVNKAVLTTYK